ncbi:MAG: hypothetical protein CMN73_16070 [Sphingomonas sp.]|nr:hypothetical protein [Sphingomonas sp.]
MDQGIDRPHDVVSERRAASRHLTVYRTARMCIGDVQRLMLVKNLSSGGLKAQVYEPVPIGTLITAELTSGKRIEGTVVWADTPHIGVQFTREIDVADILHLPFVASTALERLRFPVLDISASGLLRAPHESAVVTVHGVGTTGARFEWPALPRHDDVFLQIEGLEPHRGHIVWEGDGMAEIGFFRPIAFATLAEWATRRQPLGLRLAATA